MKPRAKFTFDKAQFTQKTVKECLKLIEHDPDLRQCTNVKPYRNCSEDKGHEYSCKYMEPDWSYAINTASAAIQNTLSGPVHALTSDENHIDWVASSLITDPIELNSAGVIQNGRHRLVAMDTQGLSSALIPVVIT